MKKSREKFCEFKIYLYLCSVKKETNPTGRFPGNIKTKKKCYRKNLKRKLRCRFPQMNAERISRYNKQKIKDMIQNVGEDNRWIGCMLINFSPRDLRKIGKALGIKCDDLKFMSLKEVYSLI